MRRILFTFLLSLVSAISVLAQNDAMFVYRNDGVINAFLKSDVDSLRLSRLDLDSVYHENYVVQEVWTIDSIYRVPLEVVDSVSFVAPPTIYKSDVIDLAENLADYIIGAENKVLRLKSNTPSKLIPRKNDKLIFLQTSDVLPNGFAGTVVSVNMSASSIDVVCEQAYIEDIFESFCSVKTFVGYADNTEEHGANQRLSSPQQIVYNPVDTYIPIGPIKFSQSHELALHVTPDSDLAFKGGIDFSLTVEPSFRIHTFLIVGENQGVYFNGSVTGNWVQSSTTSIYGGLEFQHEFLNPVINAPIIPDILNFYINPGAFIRANAMVTSTVKTTKNYSFGMAYDFSSKGESVVKPTLGGRLVSSTEDVEGSLDGNIAIGMYLELGFNLMSRDISRACVRGEVGVQLSGNFVLRNSDINNAEKETKLYERLKASSVEFGPFFNVALVASVLNADATLAQLQMSGDCIRRDLVPTFKNTRLSRASGTRNSLDAYTELYGNCIFEVPVGYKLFDSNMKEVAEITAASPYNNQPSTFNYTFTGLKSGEQYTVYPKVRVLGHDILANPKAVYNVVLPKVTNFEQTNSYYSEKSYYNDGQLYDYKYEAATTVEIESLEGVTDWGYVYKDPNGNEKHISLMQYGTSYTDTRYAYYRNEPYSSACLYGYVKYKGDNEYYYEDPYDYPLAHTDFEATIEELWSNYEIYARDSNGEGYVQYSLSALTSASSLDDAEDWGIYLYDDKSNEYKIFSYRDNEYEMQEGCVYLEWDVPEDSYEEFDDVKFYAMKGIEMGVYKKLIPTADMINPVYIFGAPLVFEFSYDQKPSVTFENNEVYVQPYSNGVQYYVEYEGTSYFTATGTLWMKDLKIKQTFGDGYTGYTSDALDFGDIKTWWYKYSGGYYTNSLDAYNTFEAEVYLKNGSTIKGTNYVIWNYGETQVIDYGGNRTRQRIQNANSSTPYVLRMEDKECDLPIIGSIHCEMKEDQPLGDANARKLIPLRGQVW